MLVKETLQVLGYSLLKAPLAAFCMPRIERLDEKECHLKIPLRFRTKNPLGSLYFGAQAIGGDLAGSLIAYHVIGKKKLPVSVVFKDCKMDFLRRAESDTVFVCKDGEKIGALVDKAYSTGERVEELVHVEAYAKEKGTSTLCTTFVLTLSLKKRK